MESNIKDLPRKSTLHCYNSKMDNPVLVPSNNGNGNQQNQDQTYTRQLPATTKQRETTPITQKSDASSNINTVEIVSSNDILKAALRPSTILKYKTCQTKWNNYCVQNNHIYSLKQVNCWTTLFICIFQGHLIVLLIPVKVPSLILCFCHHIHLF